MECLNVASELRGRQVATAQLRNSHHSHFNASHIALVFGALCIYLGPYTAFYYQDSCPEDFNGDAIFHVSVSINVSFFPFLPVL